MKHDNGKRTHLVDTKNGYEGHLLLLKVREKGSRERG
jgi:hypothetical protein